MYQYYMGKRSNLSYKSPGDPIVIEISENSSRKINEWLMKHNLDFDELVNAIISIINIPIAKMLLDENENLYIEFTSGQVAFLCFMKTVKPKCRLVFETDIYVFSLQEKFSLESTIHSTPHARFYTDEIEGTIRIENNQTTLTFKLEQFDKSLYSAMKEQINELESWENILHVTSWMKSLPTEIDSYDLIITSNDSTGCAIDSLFVVHHQIFKLIHEDETGVFQVEYDGAWETKVGGICYKHNVFEKKYKMTILNAGIIPRYIKMMGLPNGVQMAVVNVTAHFLEVKEHCEILFHTLEFINDNLA